MSWMYVPGAVSEAGSRGSLECERSATSSGTPTASNCSKRGCGTGASTRPPCGTTSRPSTGDRGVDAWMASLEASRVSPTPSPAKEREKPTSEIFGPISGESFAKLSRDGSSLRTYQGCLFGGWKEYSERLPRAGIILSNGTAYPLQVLAPLTGGIASGLWLTPSVEDAGREANGEWAERWANGETPPTCHQRLRTQVAARPPMWPTPVASEPGQGDPDDPKRGKKLTWAAKMWPTPVVGDATGGRTSKGKDRPDEGGLRLEAMKRETFPTPQRSDSARGPDRKKADREGSGGDDLVTHVAKQWPTPRASDERGTGPLGSASHQHRLDRGVLDATVQEEEQRSGGLNPRWVEWLMGWPPEWTNPNCSLLDPTPDTWAREPAGVSRLAPRSMPASERRARLSIIGNGWVPQCAAVVFARINAYCEEVVSGCGE